MLDANCGFWQILLADSSRHLTTFITPYGRFCFNKLPFGISSSPEHFQRRMSDILEGQEGWPDRPHLKGDLLPYWHVRGDLTLHDNLLLYGSRIVVPKSLQATTLQKIHNGHQGIQKCRQRTTSSVWWPGVSKHIEQLVKSCPMCAKASIPHKEPLMYSPLPNHPWEKVGSDLFELNGSTYLLVVDNFSCFIEIQKVSSINSRSVILALKAIFSRHGVPATLVSDNGSQYAS